MSVKGFNVGGTPVKYDYNSLDDGILKESIVADYSSSSTYIPGDLVLYDGTIYRCINEISTAESFNAAHWYSVSLSEIILNEEKGRFRDKQAFSYNLFESSIIIDKNMLSLMESEYTNTILKVTGTTSGTSLQNIQKYVSTNPYSNYRINVKNIDFIAFFQFASTSGYGSIFLDENDCYVSGFTSETATERIMRVPNGATTFLYSTLRSRGSETSFVILNSGSNSIYTIINGGVKHYTADDINHFAKSINRGIDLSKNVVGEKLKIYSGSGNSSQSGYEIYYLNIDGAKKLKTYFCNHTQDYYWGSAFLDINNNYMSGYYRRSGSPEPNDYTIYVPPKAHIFAMYRKISDDTENPQRKYLDVIYNENSQDYINAKLDIERKFLEAKTLGSTYIDVNDFPALPTYYDNCMLSVKPAVIGKNIYDSSFVSNDNYIRFGNDCRRGHNVILGDINGFETLSFRAYNYQIAQSSSNSWGAWFLDENYNIISVFDHSRLGGYQTLNIPSDAHYFVYLSQWYMYFDNPDSTEDRVYLTYPTAQIESGGEYKDLGLHIPTQDQNVLNIIKKARQITDLKWSTVKNLPRNSKLQDWGLVDCLFETNKEYTGLPYIDFTTGQMWGASNLEKYKRIAFVYTPVDTFLTSTKNASSYLCNFFDNTIEKARIYYGCMCSGLVSYVLNVPYTSTSAMLTVDDNHSKGIPGLDDTGFIVGTMDLNNLMLADIVTYYSSQLGHTAIISDIIKEGSTIKFIEVSEETTVGLTSRSFANGLTGGLARRVFFNVEDFISRYGLYHVMRYTGDVDYTQNPYSPMVNEGKMLRIDEYPLMPTFGNHYRLNTTPSGTSSERTIKLLIDDTNYDKIVFTKNGASWIPNGGTEILDITNNLSDGYVNIVCDAEDAVYTAKLQTTVGSTVKTSVACEWYVFCGSTTRDDANNPTISCLRDVSNNTLNFTITCGTDEFYPWFYKLNDEYNSNILPISGKYVMLNNGVTKTGSGPYVYTFSADDPGNVTYFLLGLKSNKFGTIQKIGSIVTPS